MTDTLTLAPQRVSRWKRVGYSLLSMALADIAVAALTYSTIEILAKAHHAQAKLGYDSPVIIFEIAFYFGSIAIFGWVLSLPIILMIRYFSAIKLWILLLIGSAIGPIVMLVMDRPHKSNLADESTYVLFLLATAVSFTTSLIFLFFMRRMEYSAKA
jgi:hypothetical protein